jgi:ComEC/Rec2-related protein
LGLDKNPRVTHRRVFDFIGQTMKRPLLPVALCYAGGLLLAEAAQPPLMWLFAASFFLLVLAIALVRYRALFVWPLLVLVGWTNMVHRTAIISPQDLRTLVGIEPVLATVRGVLEETPSVRLQERGSEQFSRSLVRVRVSALSLKENWQPATGDIIVTSKGQLSSEFFAGREVEITGVLAPPQRPVAPGLFDYANYLARQGIHFQMKADLKTDWRLVDLRTNAAPPFSDRFLNWAQQTLARGLNEQDESLQLMWAMTLGWKTALTGEVNEPFMRSGTMHIFAISGLHIALIAGILVSLLRVVRVPRNWCGLVVIPLIWFYTGATGCQSSAIRSTIMMTIIIGGWSLRRPTDLINSLAAAGFAILLWDPQQLFQAGFQLSFFVVLSIALFMPPLEKLRDKLLAVDPLLAPEMIPKWKRLLRGAARVVLTSLVTSLAAWLGSLPLTGYYFYLFSPVTLLANLLVVPMSSVTLMCNLGSLITGDLFPAATELFNNCGWAWMLAMIKVSRWSTEIPGAFYYVPAPSAVTFVFYYGLLVGTMSGWLWKPEQRRRTLVALALVAAFYCFQFLRSRNEITLTILPLNGGHAAHLDAPGQAADWLIDCGNTNSVEFITRPYLRSRGVNHLPRLALTHGDLRHVGGIYDLDEEFSIGEVFASSFRFRSVAYRRIFNDFQREPKRLRTVHRGDAMGVWQVLHPTAADEATQADDGALVLRGEFHGVSVLLLSDLGRIGQNLLFDREPNLRADIIVTGIPTQSEPINDALLDLIQPQLIIVTDPEIPATERASEWLRERLGARRIPVIYTRSAGAVEISFRPERCVVVPMKESAVVVSPNSGR